MSLDTPLAKVRGLGSARNGTQHFIAQRVSAIALIPLVLWFLFCVVAGVRGEYADARAFVAQPWNAGLLILTVIALFWHGMLGVQTVIEDYVHTPFWEISLQLINKFFAIAGMVIAVLAIVRIALGA